MIRNRLIQFGFVGVLVGAVLPFLILLGIIPSTFFINFLAFIVSILGIFLGVIGVATHVGEHRNKNDDYWEE